MSSFQETALQLNKGVDTYNPDVTASELQFTRLKNIQPKFGRWMTPDGLKTKEILDDGTFNPAIIAATLTWWDINAMTGHVDGDFISTVPNLAPTLPNRYGTSSANPVYKTNIQAGKPGLFIDSQPGGSYKTVDEYVPNGVTGDQRHVFLVSKGLWSGFTSTAAGFYYITRIGATKNFRGVVNTNKVDVSFGETFGGTYFLNGVNEMAVGNANLLNTNIYEWQYPVSTSPEAIHLGLGANSTPAAMPVYFFELMTFNTILSPADRLSVLKYLKTKWSTP